MSSYKIQKTAGKTDWFIEDRFGRVKAKKGNLSFVEINL